MRVRAVIVNVAMAPAILIAAGTVAWAVYLLFVGTETPTFRAVPYWQPQEPPIMVRVTYQPAVIPLVAALLTIAGLLARRMKLARAGVGALMVFSGLFIFGAGGTFIPAAGLLFVLMILIKVVRESPG